MDKGKEQHLVGHCKFSNSCAGNALASVDNKTAAKIIDEMRARSKKTIIMISHQLSVAATCDRVLVMDKGEIVQEGNHKDLVKQRGLYKQLWERELATNIVNT